VNAAFNAADVQGNIVRGYRKPRVRHLIIEVADRAAARRWLAATLSARPDGIPQITTEEPWETKPATCFNIGLTYQGLRALGTPGASLETFPTEFIEGMASRALKLGDAGPSAPENWPAPFDDQKRLHLVASIYADDVTGLDRVQAQALPGGTGLNLLGTRDGMYFAGDTVHFGYRDSIAQPKFAEIHDPADYPDGQPMAPLGTVLLGYPTNFEGLVWRVPQPQSLGHNGTFNAFRVLAQDVTAFEAYLDKAAAELDRHPRGQELLAIGAEATMGADLSRIEALREIVAACMCGRWRNGVPLALSPDTPNPQPPVAMENFDYSEASTCPYGAHIRRANPRGGKIVQRVANHSRRLIRRGMPYGPAYDPAVTAERGLLGNFIGANLGAQFEAMSCDWLNLGLQDPRVTGSNDPLLGANDPETSWFDIPFKTGQPVRLRGLPRFVQTRGGAYTFLPSISAIRYLGSLTN
jgi:deferrochelatase/peroxidase EfeB